MLARFPRQHCNDTAPHQPRGHLYGGKILWIDLSSGDISTRSTLDYADDFIGGRGINARIMYDTIGPETDPLGPDNVIAFGTGPLSGTAYPGCSRTDVMSKSPVTGLLGNTVGPAPSP